MNRCSLLRRSLLGLAAAAILAAAAPAQGSSFTVTPYTPRVFDSDALLDTAAQLYGPTIEVDEDDAGLPRGDGVTKMAHFIQLGDLILIRDTPEMAKKIVATLTALEAEELKNQKDAADAREADDRRAAAEADGGATIDDFTATQPVDVRPRYVSFETLVAALKPYERPVRYAPEGGQGWTTRNVNPIESGNLVVLCETAARLKRLLELVDRIDQPRPQMSISVMLVKPGGGDGKDGKRLPKELAENLRALLPEQEFSLLSVGMLRCSAQSEMRCELRMNLVNGGNWSLKFLPEAFDARTGELSLNHCTFHCELPVEGRSPAIQDFDTSLTIKAGEYVVLGAIGADPTFVVLRAEPVRRAQ